MSVRGTDIIRPVPTVASVVVDGEGVLYDEATNSLHVLDRVGIVVWTCLDGASSLNEIADDLADIFGAPTAAVRRDVRTLIGKLTKLELVTAVGQNEPDPPAPKRPQRRRSPKFIDEPPNG